MAVQFLSKLNYLKPDDIQIDVDLITEGPHFNGDTSEGFGSIDLTVWGCNPNESYSYDWTYELDPDFNSNTQDVSSLFAGTYNVLITDSNGNTNSVDVTVPFYSPEDWDVDESDEIHEIEIPANLNITIDDDAISYGDYLLSQTQMEI